MQGDSELTTYFVAGSTHWRGHTDRVLFVFLRRCGPGRWMLVEDAGVECRPGIVVDGWRRAVDCGRPSASAGVGHVSHCLLFNFAAGPPGVYSIRWRRLDQDRVPSFIKGDEGAAVSPTPPIFHTDGAPTRIDSSSRNSSLRYACTQFVHSFSPSHSARACLLPPAFSECR